MNNQDYFERSKKVSPGGVHSPVRSFKGLPVPPRFVKSAEGASFTDVEGKRYLDFCMSFGPLILGHRPPEVEEALQKALKDGWSYGACETRSLELAEFLLERLPFVQKIRFMNSGTEAVMTALRLARGFSKRDKIVKFDGCYHGHTDAMLIKAGSGLAGTATASSLGVPENVAKDTLIVELGNVEALARCFKDHPGQIAAVIIEPLPANNGLLIQTTEFLKYLRQITAEHGALLIFDEVISGFRVGFQGMVGATGITPDLVTYGKIIGGGLPVGAVAGPSKIMDLLAPLGGVYQAGTLSANPLAMASGLATLKCLTPALYKELESATKRIVAALQGRYKSMKFVQHSSLFWAHGGDFTPFFMDLLDRGIYLAPNAYEVSFVSRAHTGGALAALEQALK